MVDKTMLILRPYENKVFLPVPKAQWRTPSAAQPKNEFGQEDRTRFVITARLDDGHVIWRGFFDDYEDFDAFSQVLILHQITGIPIPREDWFLPTPNWHPDLGENVQYEFLSFTTLTTTGSNQTFTSPSNWNNSSNKIAIVAGGGTGAVTFNTAQTTGLQASGGGGGEYRELLNFVFATPGTTTATYRIAASVGSPTRTGNGNTNGNNGQQTWWDGSTFAGASLGAQPGQGGTATTSGTVASTGGSGGTGGTGGTGNDGGRGGNVTAAANASGASGGGGAGGPNAAGIAAADITSTNGGSHSAGGRGDGTSGGNGGTVPGGTGQVGSEYDDGVSGSGGGGAGRDWSDASGNAGSGGHYGGGGGGVTGKSGTLAGGSGVLGVIVLSYTPAVSNVALSLDNFDAPIISVRMAGYDGRAVH